MRGLHDIEGRFSHQALFYRDTQDYLAGTVPFILRGLAQGESVVVAVPEHHIRLLERALGPAADRIRLLDMNDVGRNPGRVLPTLLRFFSDAQGPARLLGEPVWQGRSTEEYLACVQHEALINLAFADWAATFLCPYDINILSPEAVADVEATHTVLVDSTGTWPSTAYAPHTAYERCNVPLPIPDGAFTLPFDIEALSEVRRTATEFAACAGFGENRLQDVALAVGEICANSVQHGGGRGVFAIWRHEDGVVFEVTDKGRLTDPLAGRRPPAAHQYGGWGLLLVNQISDLVRTHTGPEGLTTQVYLRW
ncbi:sensor histidine kinase [Saccharomonospora sp.]|uniref:sensor histidine kinase n=1 Tax=Saccharomonospora sp. TaxID=33913 RepID=UPI00260CF024|nr:sensor histidine kinase [Saccharomonospora sp.]